MKEIARVLKKVHCFFRLKSSS